MTYLIRGLIVFATQILIVVASSVMFPEIFDTFLKGWYSLSFGIIAILYFYFGHQTIKKEKHYLGGIMFFVLAIITFYILLIANAKY